MALYPNPASAMLMLSSGSPVLRIRIMDLSGRAVLDERPAGNTVDVRALSAGHYVVEMTTRDGVRWTERLVKE
jgi:hypothetical protein